MSRFPLSELYPDVARQGSLVGAFRDLASSEAIDLGVIDPAAEGWAATSACCRRGDRLVTVVLGSEERWLIAECWQRGAVLAAGKTPDLPGMVRAVSAFLGRARLADLSSAFPFMSVHELGPAFEEGTEVAAKWEQILTRADDIVRPVAAVAALDPTLRSLFPFTSHHALGFSRCTGYPYTRDIPFIEPGADGAYRVRFAGGPVLADGLDPSAAVDTLLAHLPRPCGPAVPGAAEELG